MPAPALFPEVDLNGSNQPADPAGIPQAIKDDGFLEKQSVPNTWWNWLFKLLHDWIVYLSPLVSANVSTLAKRGYVYYKENVGPVVEIKFTPQTLTSYSLPSAAMDDTVVKITAGVYCPVIPAAATSMALVLKIGTKTIARCAFPPAAVVADNVGVTATLNFPPKGAAVAADVAWQSAYHGDVGGADTHTLGGGYDSTGGIDTTGALTVSVTVEMTVNPGNKVALGTFTVETSSKA